MNNNFLTNISGNVNRRNFLRNMALIGASSFAASSLQAEVLSNNADDDPFQMGGAPAKKPVDPSKLTVKQVLENAREALMPHCRICPECDGVVCAGESQMGGVGSGMSFRNNFSSLQRICLKMNTLVDTKELTRKPDSSTIIFGQKLAFPAMAAPVGPVVLNFGQKIEKDKYFNAIIGGCVDAGVPGSIGDNANLTLDVFKKHCDYIAAVNGKAFITLKPRSAEKMIPLFPHIEQAGTFMIAIDVDSGGLFPTADLLKITQSTKLPVVVKGVMTINDAKRALDAGAKGIVVSNHGGRRLDYTLGTADVLPIIADAMKGKLTIFADGSVRYGADVLKYLALGADCVLVGRHILKGAFGGGREGVALFMNTMQKELISSMSLTGVSNVKNITRDILANNK